MVCLGGFLFRQFPLLGFCWCGLGREIAVMTWGAVGGNLRFERGRGDEHLNIGALELRLMPRGKGRISDLRFFVAWWRGML